MHFQGLDLESVVDHLWKVKLDGTGGLDLGLEAIDRLLCLLGSQRLPVPILLVLDIREPFAWVTMATSYHACVYPTCIPHPHLHTHVGISTPIPPPHTHMHTHMHTHAHTMINIAHVAHVHIIAVNKITSHSVYTQLANKRYPAHTHTHTHTHTYAQTHTHL